MRDIDPYRVCASAVAAVTMVGATAQVGMGDYKHAALGSAISVACMLWLAIDKRWGGAS